MDHIKFSKFNNLKELRPLGKNIRNLYAFDPERKAILLVGGDKTNEWSYWYRRNIKLAEQRFEKHLKSMVGRKDVGNGKKKYYS